MWPPPGWQYDGLFAIAGTYRSGGTDWRISVRPGRNPYVDQAVGWVNGVPVEITVDHGEPVRIGGLNTGIWRHHRSSDAEDCFDTGMIKDAGLRKVVEGGFAAIDMARAAYKRKQRSDSAAHAKEGRAEAAKRDAEFSALVDKINGR
jgi:hypothetical protein